MAKSGDGDFVFRMVGAAGEGYQVEVSTNLEDWELLDERVFGGAQGQVEVRDGGATSRTGQRNYRMRLAE